MGTLPASVRLALWATATWNAAASPEHLLDRAFPDLDDLSGDLDRLELWPQIGERVLLCALPHPGHAQSLPKGDAEFLAQAMDAGECVFVPMFGGALVPRIEPYGPTGDQGWRARLQAHDCAPTPIHRVEMLTDSAIERGLQAAIAAATAELDDIDLVPWQRTSERDRAASELSGAFGLPAGIPARLARTIWSAATVSEAAEVALEHDPIVGAQLHERRAVALRELMIAADAALADATNLAAVILAGLVPAR